MRSEFAERRAGGFYVAGSRVLLDSIVEEYLKGESAEEIQGNFDTLSLEAVEGAIQFYLEHKAEVDEAMAERARLDEEYALAHPNPPDIVAKFERMRKEVANRLRCDRTTT